MNTVMSVVAAFVHLTQSRLTGRRVSESVCEGVLRALIDEDRPAHCGWHLPSDSGFLDCVSVDRG